MNIINNNEGDGDEGNSIILSDYEKLRLERIKKNKEQLKRLGLDKYNGFMRTINNKPSPKKKKTPIATTVVVKRRRSSRFESLHTKEKKSTNSNLVMLDLRRADGIEKAITQATDNDDNRNDTDERSTMTETKRRVSIDPSEYRPLTDKDRGSLSQLMKSSKLDDNYLSKFQEFLERDRLSEQNMKNVMRQVRKLASGEGIHYSSPKYGWPKNKVFQKGVKVNPMSDLIELLHQGQDYENKFGRDRGNGWLLRHPLKKLLLFQQFILNNPSFLASELKLKDYCF